MKYLVDIDGIICHNGDHSQFATPIILLDNIRRINELYDQGNEIVMYSARHYNDAFVTRSMLDKAELRYHSLLLGKPSADVYIDDKAINFVPELGNKSLSRKPLAICWSGGMDSFIAYHWARIELGYDPEDIICVNFNLNHPYYEKEKRAMDAIGIPYVTFNLNLIQDQLGNTPTVQDYIIPGRNMIFASIAAGLGERVWIVGISFEDHPFMYDKNSNFYRVATLALSQSLGTTTIVETPFSEMSKTDCIRWAAEHDLLNALDETVSCYHPTEKRCGGCGLCFKRHIAMKAAGLSEQYLVNPETTTVANDFIEKYRHAWDNNDFSHYQKDRIFETFNVLGIRPSGI